jgi:DnaJ-class molecular chaperone
MTDHYATLGVSKTATAAEIKQAFRKLASQHHPDKGGDTAKFQAIQAAYAVLGDEQKRAEYDNPQPQFGGFQGFGGGHPQFNDIFSQMFGGAFGGGAHHPRRNHLRMSLYVRLHDVATGGKKHVSVNSPTGSNTVEIDVPLGLNDGDSVQYGGIGPGGQDLVITFRIQPDPVWQRNGLNLTIEQPVIIWDLILGTEILVDNILGHSLTVKVPARTQPGTSLRLRNQGLRDRRGATGDMMLKIVPRIPNEISPELLEAIEKYRQ